MPRSALLFCAAIVAMLCFACSPIAATAPAPMGAAPPPPAAACSAAAFLGKVRYIATPFAPAPGATPPAGPLPSNPLYAQDLAAAFNAASPGFQQQLCSLDAVYINAAACSSWADCLQGSWGWRQRQPTVGRGRLVALSAGLWSTRPTYAVYETVLTQSLLPNSGIAYAQPQSCPPAAACTSVDDFPTALLAALAHEVGHIRWFELANDNPAGYCGGAFVRNSWLAPVHRPPPGSGGGYWRNLLTPGERTNLRIHNQWLDLHRSPPQLDAIDAVPPGVNQNRLLSNLLVSSAPWASLFGAMSPDEDFVETYKFKVLTTAARPLTSVRIAVPGFPTRNIVADYLAGAKLTLRTKTDCIPNSF